jgi:ACT domain-containing protein
MSKGEKKELLVITVIGLDKKGIVANISTLLYKSGINIEDITQRIMEGYFVMSMVVDVSSSKVSLEKVRSGLEKIGKNMELKIQLQHEDIFKKMHRV